MSKQALLIASACVAALAAANDTSAQTSIPVGGMGTSLSAPGNSRTRLDYGWSSAVVTGCDAELKWTTGTHIAGDLRRMSSTPYAATLNLRDLEALVVAQSSDPHIAFREYVSITVATKAGRPPMVIERRQPDWPGSERVEKYVFFADADSGRAFADRLQEEIKRCAAVE